MMRHRFLILVFVFVFSGTKAYNHPVSIASFKSLLLEYLEEVNFISEKLRTTLNADSVRFYSKKLMRLSDNMEKLTNRHYRFGGTTMQIIPVLMVTQKVPEIAIAMVSRQEQTPLITAYVNDIYDSASYIRFFFAKRPSRISKELRRIEEYKKVLEELVNE